MPPARNRTVPALDPETLARLGTSLSRFYVDTLERAVPDHLLAVIQQIKSPAFPCEEADKEDVDGPERGSWGRGQAHEKPRRTKDK